MTAAPAGTVHATAVRIDGHGVLIRGASGAGKSTLARLLVERARLAGRDGILVADDRVLLTPAVDGGLQAAPPPALAGLLEVAGLGIVRLPYAPLARLGLVVDLVPETAMERMPDAASRRTEIAGVGLARIAVPVRAALAPGLVELALDALVTGRIRLLP